MTEKQVLLVKHSWSYVAGQLDQLDSIFSKKLSDISPELKPLIRQLNKEKRIQGLMTTINHLVASLPDLRKAEKHLLNVMAVYSDLDISNNNYDNALIAFLMMLEKKLGKNWTTEIRDSWIFIFASIHQHLLRQLRLPAVLIAEKSAQPVSTN